MNIFEMLYPRFYFNKSKPIRLFEAFSGVGCQAMALKRITDKYELVGFSEIDKPAIQSYMAIHGEVKNYGDITKMERLPSDIGICTWSFPCQDISLAGKRKGMISGTRSNYGYDFLKIVQNTPREERPKFLIMENVAALIDHAIYKNDYNKIHWLLEQMGYDSFASKINAKDQSIPQNRDRVFIVSILQKLDGSHHSFAFPTKKELKLRLKDLLEEEVDEKYFLSEKSLLGCIKTTYAKYNLKNTIQDPNGICSTLLARFEGAPQLVAIKADDIYVNTSKEFQSGPLENISRCLKANQHDAVLVYEATTKGYAEAHDGDGIYINRPHQKRGVVQKSMIQTLKTSGMSNSQLYKQAGNGIVVNVFEAILREMII